jgi:hypothetical protein
MQTIQLNGDSIFTASSEIQNAQGVIAHIITAIEQNDSGNYNKETVLHLELKDIFRKLSDIDTVLKKYEAGDGKIDDLDELIKLNSTFSHVVHTISIDIAQGHLEKVIKDKTNTDLNIFKSVFATCTLLITVERNFETMIPKTPIAA